MWGFNLYTRRDTDENTSHDNDSQMATIMLLAITILIIILHSCLNNYKYNK